MRLAAVQSYKDNINYDFYTIICEKDGIFFLAQYRYTPNKLLTYWCSIEEDVIECYPTLEIALCKGYLQFKLPKETDLETHKQLLAYCEDVFNKNKERVYQRFEIVKQKFGY